MSSSYLQAFLLIDGYNIIGAWSDLQRTRDQDGLEAARTELIEIISNYSAFQGFETQLVFDAQYQDTRGRREVITSNLAVYYTDFRQTADTYIEKTCALFQRDVRRFHQRLIVATSDRAQQLTVVGYGAEWMSAQQLAADIKFTSRRINRRKRTPKASKSRFLAKCLDPSAQERLAQLRFGLTPKDLP